MRQSRRYRSIAGVVFVLPLVVASLVGCSMSQPQSKVLPSPDQLRRATANDVPTVNFCELMADSSRYVGRPLRTQITIMAFPENQLVYDSACYGKDSSAWLDFDSDEIYRRVDDKLGPLRRPNTPTRLNVTAVGRLDGPSEEGFGHLGGFKYRFVIIDVENAEAVPSDVPLPWATKTSP